jgi:hypothetical protein
LAAALDFLLAEACGLDLRVMVEDFRRAAHPAPRMEPAGETGGCE